MWDIISFLGMVGWGMALLVLIGVLADRGQRKTCERDERSRRDAGQRPR